MDNRERARASDKKQRRRISLEEKHETFIAAVRKWEIAAATKMKISGSKEKKKKANRSIYNIFSIKHLTSKFHVVVVLNNGKEMYKKVCCTYK